MASFDKLKDALAAHDLSLRLQWEEKREQGVMRHYLVYGPKAYQRDILIFLWQDGGYQIYFAGPSNSIADDVSAIVGEEL